MADRSKQKSAPAGDHRSLLRDISVLSRMLAGEENVSGYLERMVELIARSFGARTCTVYLYEPATDELVLEAYAGKRADAPQQRRFPATDSLAGAAFRDQRPVCNQADCDRCLDRAAPAGPARPERTVIAVPIRHGNDRLGVLELGRDADHLFVEEEVVALEATAAQLGSALESARSLMAVRVGVEGAAPVRERERFTGGEMFFSGKAAAEGFVLAPVLPLNKDRSLRLMGEAYLAGEYTRKDFHQALAATAAELRELQARMGERLPEVAAVLFEAHVFMLNDADFTARVEARIAAGQSAPRAVHAVATQFIDTFTNSPNAYIREKANDVEDLARRLIGNIVHREFEPSSNCAGKVVIARDLYASDILKLSSEQAGGIILVSGGVTSHVALLARSLGLPLVFADRPELLDIPAGVRVLLDAEIGNIYVNPTPTVVRAFQERDRARAESIGFRSRMKEQTLTRDGQRVQLLANINLLRDLSLAVSLKAEGVGLYRSEFPFLVRTGFPSEAEQLTVYRRLVEGMPNREVTIRTLDVGGDKILPYLDDGAEEANPFLGMRSIRFSLSHLSLFKEQVRAILRAGRDTPKLRLMFPMISSLDEFQRVREVVAECLAELERDGRRYCHDAQIGMMVEVPSLLPVIEDAAQVSDFFCIGTNDFTQYLLAVDRTNERVAPYFVHHHPAVLRALQQIAQAGPRYDCDVSICGEMAHEPRYIPFLIGIGIRKLSVDPRFLPTVQGCLSLLDSREAVQHAQELLSKSTIAETSNILAQADWPRRFHAELGDLPGLS